MRQRPPLTARHDIPGRRDSPGRPTVGFLIDAIHDGFQSIIWKGIVDATEGLDVNLLVFLAGAPWRKQKGWSIIDLMGKENVDGLVIVNGSMGCYLSESELLGHLRHLPPLPSVSLSRAVPAMPSLVVDNETAVHQLIAHLVEVHGRRRIAFIRGPETNIEAETRYRAYRESLEQHGLPLEPALVFLGDFIGDSGLRAIHDFVDLRRADFDAVVSANDYMALFAMKELQRRGFRVPEDVSVAGFDDIQDAVGVMPELTTVRQPLREMARTAIRTVLDMIRGESVEELIRFPTALVVRRSCGCTGAMDDEGRENRSKTTSLKTDDRHANLASLFRSNFPRGEKSGSPVWAEELAQALLADLDADKTHRFLPLLEKLIAEGLEHQIGATEWYGALSATFEDAQPLLEHYPCRHLARLLQGSLILVGRLAEHTQIALHTKSQEELKILPWVLSAGQFDEDSIRRGILRDLPTAGIPSFYLSLYSDESHQHASLFVHYSFSRCVTLDDPQRVFPVRELVPGRFTSDQRRSFALLPICPQSTKGGFALCEMSALEPETYEFLTSQISAAFRVTSLMSEVRQYANQLEIKVEERTGQLKDAQRQLVEAARHSGMAEIAIELMHNVGNLLNSVSVSAEEIYEVVRHSKIEGLMKATDLLASRQDDSTADEGLRLLFDYYDKVTGHLKTERSLIQDEIVRVLARTKMIRDTIKALRDYAEGDTGDLAGEVISVPEVIETVLRIQESRLLEGHISVRRDFEVVPAIIGQRAKVVHVLVGVVRNAFEAMRETPEDERRLDVSVGRDAEGRVLIRIADTGEGIAEENLTRLFAHGFTTRAGSHGFGLHTSANYMAQMGGSMMAESNGPGRGAIFTLTFRAASP